MDMLRLAIIASCTNRKRLPAPEALQLHTLASTDLEERCRRWCERIETTAARCLTAADLYAGSFWSVVKKLPAMAATRGYDAHLYVASAGYGLVDSESPLKPYSATFADSTDNVAGRRLTARERKAVNQNWWHLLSTIRMPAAYSGPRSIRDLAQADPSTSIIVVAAGDYINAMENDLLQATAHLSAPDNLVLVSSRRGTATGPLQRYLVPSEAALEPVLSTSGVLGNLHARTALEILSAAGGPLSATQLRQQYESLLAQVAPRVTPRRLAATDNEVRGFIQTSLCEGPVASATRLLRAWRRTHGRQCEQGRFRRLYLETLAASNET